MIYSFDGGGCDFVFGPMGNIAYGNNQQAICDLDGFTMQYTGLKDLKGVEIYEGDIIGQYVGRELEIDPREVHWNKQKCAWWLYLYKNTHISLEASRKELKVIGNIYENPELLEQ